MPNTSLRSFIGITETGPLIVTPVERESLAFQVSTVVQTAGHTFRLPKITRDPSAAWVEESAEIPLSEATADEVVVIPRKVAGLSVISNELANDTSPEAAGVIGDGLGRDTANKVDAAFFGAPGNPALQPGGLESVTPATIIVANPATGIGPFIDALAAAEDLGVVIDNFVVDPGTARSLAKLTSGTGSNLPLFGTGATNGIERNILGIPLRVSPHVLPGTAWAIPSSRTFVVLRKDVSIDIDSSAFFTSDRTAIRSVMRIGFGFVQTQSIIKIKQGG